MDELKKIVELFNVDLSQKLPIEIPNVTRETLTKIFNTLDYKLGAEIGTERGLFAETICKNNPQTKLYCIDTYIVYPGYRDYDTKEQKLINSEQEAHNRLSKFNVEFIKEYSMDALKYFEDGSLDFVYIDANHEWPFISQDVYYWAKKVRSGGIISGHDYYRSNRKDSKCHVKSVINAYTYAFRINPWFILGRDERRPDEVRDTSRSWFWVKE